MIAKLADVIMNDEDPGKMVDNEGGDIINDGVADPEQAPEDESKKVQDMALLFGGGFPQQSVQIEVSEKEEEKMEDAAKVIGEKSALDEVIEDQMVVDTTQKN